MRILAASARMASVAGLALWSGTAAAHIGPSFLRIEGVDGGAKEEKFTGWVRAEANYWTKKPVLPEIRGAASQKDDLLFTGPVAPATGPEMLAIAVDKASPALAALMERCRSGAAIPELTFAESADLARHPQEHGPRPADIPEYYRYRLRDVRLTCPTVADAPEQAFGLHFQNIEWLNYRPHAEPRAIRAPAAKLPAKARGGTSRVFALSWFAAAVDSHPQQCARMNAKPGEEDYYRLMSAEEAAKQRAIHAEGVGPDVMSFRGPDRMNVALMPGIVADPGHVAPQADVVPGFDLDGDDGSGPPPPGTRKHRNFTSPDGRGGIDNQLFTVEGCVEGFRRKGFLPMIFNEGRAAGRPTALIEISGIDDERNDDDVTVTFYYSTDPLRRSPAKVVLADYTYRITGEPEYTQDFARFSGRIVDGILTTSPIDRLHMHEVTGIETTFLKPRLRLEMLADGTLKGLIGGYLDWRQRVVWQTFRAADYENTIGFQSPAIYNAMKRAADGIQDPATGEFTGISAAFEIEGVSGFLPPAQRRERVAHTDDKSTERTQ
ncbi:MAG: hypothetical protein WCY29_01095 [Novosphingobium sp.]